MTRNARTGERLALGGGCQCGAVRYVARPETTDAYYCHCRMCQKAFGNLFGAFFGVDGSDLEWPSGEPAYYDSSRIARRGFCPACGTPLTFQYRGSDEVHLSVGSLDDPEVTRPVAHYGFESVVRPFFAEDGLPKHNTDDNEEFVREWKEAHGPDSEPGPLPASR